MLHTNNPIIKHKAGLLNLAEELGNVSKACKVMGVSRDTFYRYQELVEEGGIDNLISKSRRAPNTKNRVDDITEQAVIAYAIEQPSHGQHRTSNELRKMGVFVSGSGVRSIWLRNNLENFKKRLKALEHSVATDGIILSDAQIAALEKKKHDDEACGEIETHHPGYLGSQDTFYVGNLKGVGRIYQQTFVDTYSKVAFCKLYTTKTPITAADTLNDKVLPFFEQYDVWLTPTLTRPPPPLGWFDFDPENRHQSTQRMEQYPRFTSLANVTGQPAISLPLCWNDEGLPIGIQLMGRYADEATLLRVAAQLEVARPWAHRWPDLG